MPPTFVSVLTPRNGLGIEGPCLLSWPDREAVSGGSDTPDHDTYSRSNDWIDRLVPATDLLPSALVYSILSSLTTS